ncbi:MAG: cell filamentation protein Fic, partial [Patescibacteria group bacterium]
MDTSSPRRLWPAVVTTTKEEARKINEAVRNGELRPLGLKLFTPNFSDSDEKVIKDNLWRVVGLLAPGAVVSYRTAIEGKPTENDTVFLVGNSRYERKIPGLNLRVNKGPGPQASDRPFIGGLFLASRPRALLEALKPSRERGGVRKGLFEREVESVLEREFEAGGEQKLNAIRDQARDLAPLLSADAEFKRLDRLIGVLLGSRTGATTNRSATARLSGNAYDPGRVSLLQK